MCMRSLLVSVCLLCLSLATVLGADDSQSPSSKQPSPDEVGFSNSLSSMPIAFTKNIGQWPDSILFRASGGGATMWFTRDGIYYQYTRRIEKAEATNSDGSVAPAGTPDKLDHERDSIETAMIKAEFIESNPNVEVIGLDELDYKCNYFIGNDPNKWHTDVPNYSGFILRELYPGVDVSFRCKKGTMDYEIAASSSLALAQLQVDYRGADGVDEQADGTTLVNTSLGKRLFTGILPKSSHLSTEFKSPVGSSSPTGLTLVYSTYLGGSGADAGLGIAVDGSGNTYVTGETASIDFPIQSQYQNDQGASDVFVTKLSATGTSLIYSTYLGGSGTDEGLGIAVDGSGNAYMTGVTSSWDFPTQSPYQTPKGTDVFVTKLSASGTSLVYSTHLGGSLLDFGLEIAVDGSGSAYVTGWTTSTDFPTESPYQTDPGDGAVRDAFVTKLSTIGNSLQYSTYLGGGGLDAGYGIAVDGAGNAYVTGYTSSADFPAQSPYQTDQGGIDVFVTKLSASGTNLECSTFLGGSGDDYGYGIAVDGSGSAYVTGWTTSIDFPIQSPYQTYQGGGFTSDVFVTKLSATCTSLVYSTYLGGGGWDEGYDIAVDGSGNAYVTGYTQSTDFPVRYPHQIDTDFIYDDVFVTKLSASGTDLVYSTYLSGSLFDFGNGIAVDGSGNAHVAGYTNSANFPTESPYQTDPDGGGDDVFITKLSFVCCEGTTGNINKSLLETPDLTDLSMLIGFLTLSPRLTLPCIDEANVNGTGVIDLSDLSLLIAYLTLTSRPVLPSCP